MPEEKEHLIDDDFDRYRFSVLPIIGQLEESTRHGLQISEHKVGNTESVMLGLSSSGCRCTIL